MDPEDFKAKTLAAIALSETALFQGDRGSWDWGTGMQRELNRSQNALAEGLRTNRGFVLPNQKPPEDPWIAALALPADSPAGSLARFRAGFLLQDTPRHCLESAEAFLSLAIDAYWPWPSQILPWWENLSANCVLLKHRSDFESGRTILRANFAALANEALVAAKSEIHPELLRVAQRQAHRDPDPDSALWTARVALRTAAPISFTHPSYVGQLRGRVLECVQAIAPGAEPLNPYLAARARFGKRLTNGWQNCRPKTLAQATLEYCLAHRGEPEIAEEKRPRRAAPGAIIQGDRVNRRS